MWYDIDIRSTDFLMVTPGHTIDRAFLIAKRVDE